MISECDQWIPIVNDRGKIVKIKHRACGFRCEPYLKDRYRRCPKCNMLMGASILERYSRTHDKKIRISVC